jgi:hypothetical protein
MEKKQKCNSCKKKPLNNITNLTGDINMEELSTAFNYLQITSQLNNEKWDLIEKVLNDLYPQKHPLNRSCKQCLIQAAKVIEHEYKKYTN